METVTRSVIARTKRQSVMVFRTVQLFYTIL